MSEKGVYEIWLAESKGLSGRAKLALLSECGSAEEIFRLSDADISQFAVLNAFQRSFESINRDLKSAREYYESTCKSGMKLLFFADDSYPAALRSIADPPLLLYGLGDLSVLDGICISVVGTRRASPYGKWAAKEIGRRIAECGAAVISGMAEGIDAMSHVGALSANGKTCAVFGTGADNCFPKCNKSIYDSIVKNGLVLSEYPPGSPGYSFNFPRRNRIISGLSKATIVVEGALKSGSMITANCAAEQGKEVWAVPGNINQPNSIGVNKLIADGAYPVMDLDSLPQILGLISGAKKRKLDALSPEEKEVLRCISESPGISIDELPEELQSGALLPLISSLELKSLIRREGSRLYV